MNRVASLVRAWCSPPSLALSSITTPSSVSQKNVLRGNLNHCIDLLRHCDYDNYCVSLMIPAKHRCGFIALHAFNIETGRVQDMAKTPDMARMRLLWWRDTVTRAHKGEQLDHPVANMLMYTLKQFGLPKHRLHRIIDAREHLVEEPSSGGMPQLEAYAESTSSSLLYLVLRMAGVDDSTSDHAASHIGKANYLTLLLRSIAHLARIGTIALPPDIINHHQVNLNKLMAGQAHSQLDDAVYEIACHARAHQTSAEKLRASMPKNACKYLLSLVPTRQHLNELQKVNFNVFDNSLWDQTNHLRLQAYLLYYRCFDSF